MTAADHVEIRYWFQEARLGLAIRRPPSSCEHPWFRRPVTTPQANQMQHIDKTFDLVRKRRQIALRDRQILVGVVFNGIIMVHYGSTHNARSVML